MKRFLTIVLLFVAGPALANIPQVVAAKASHTGTVWQFDVTLRHADTGWKNYANGWGIYTKDGRELGYRILMHPHVDEQPFTRSLGNVILPEGLKQVVIRPHDLLHGWGPDFILTLP